MKGFREFVLRGNVVDLAVAVVVGAAFGLVVSAVVKDFITPLIGIPGGVDLSAKTLSVNGSVFRYGDFVDVVVNFVLVAAAVYFVVVVPMARLSRLRAEPPTDVDTRECPECLSTIPKAARRCSFCTSVVGVEA
jgi:large conductance mechanosensitive channel